MVMQYLIQRNDEYGKHVEELDKKLERIVDILEVLEYNILAIQKYIQESETPSDVNKKEVWFDKYGKTV